MEKIYISFIKDLKNQEFIALFDELSRMLDEEEPVNAPLKKATEKIKKQCKELLVMKGSKPRHPLTQVISKKVHSRTEVLTRLRMRVESDMLSHKPEERIAAERLQLWLSGYKKALYAPSILLQGELVKLMIHDRLEQVDIQKAITLLHLDELLEKISEITSEINSSFLERLRDKNYKSVKGQEIRNKAYVDLFTLISIMTGFYNLSDNNKDKEKLAQINREISYTLKKFHTKLKSRNTKRKNNKERGLAVKGLINTEREDSEEEKVLPIIINDQFENNPAESLLLFISTQKYTSISFQKYTI